MPALQLLSLFLCCAALLSFIEKRVLLTLGSVLLGVFVVLQASSVILLGKVADERFYIHLANPGDVLAVSSSFRGQTVQILLTFLVVVPGLYFCARGLARCKPRIVVNAALVLICCGAMFVRGGILANVYSTASLFRVDDIEFSQALEQLGIPPDDYPTKDQIRAKRGKNVIVLALESFERGYLQPSLAHLTPNVSRLKSEYSYFNMEQCNGGGYTNASIYMTLTGVPAFMERFGIADFNSVEDCKIVAFSDVLRAASYDLTYFTCSKDFMGKGDLLHTFGFQVVSGEGLRSKYEQTAWGLHDKDLFAEIESAILTKAKAGQPFCIFASTLATHFPDGVYDERMEALLPSQPSKVEFMASALDYHIGKLIELLKANRLYDDTAIVLLPDHLFMGSGVASKFESRGLFVISNADPRDLSYELSSRGGPSLTQMDVPKIILESAGVEHNAKFLVDFLDPSTDRKQYIENNKSAILNLNVAAIKDSKRPNCAYGITVRTKSDETIEILNERKQPIVEFETPPGKSFYLVKFDARMRMETCTLERDPRLFANGSGSDESHTEIFGELIVAKVGDQAYACFRRGPFLKIAKKGKTIHFDREELAIFDEWIFEPLTKSVSTRARFPCDLALPPACAFVTGSSGGSPPLGSRDYSLHFTNGPSPAGFHSFALLLLSAGERYSLGLRAKMPCQEDILIYPRLENPSLVMVIPSTSTPGDACSLRATAVMPIPSDPSARDAPFSAQWIAINWKNDDGPSWIMTLSQEMNFRIGK